MVFALLGINTGEFSQGLFQASLFGAMAAAVLGYAIWLVYRLLNKKQQGKAGESMIKQNRNVSVLRFRFPFISYKEEAI